MRNLMVEKSPGSSTEKSDAPELKTRKPHMTVPALSLPDSSVASPFGQTSPITSKIGSLSPRNTSKSTRSHFYDNSPRALSPRPHPDDKIFSIKDVQPFPLRSELFPSSKSDLKKSISALATLLMQKIENQIRQSLELKLANTPDPTQDGEDSQGVLSEQMIKALGRMDHPVMANDLPAALEYLNPSPAKLTIRFEHLLQGLFSDLIKDKGINTVVDFKKMQALINHGDLTIAVGENDPEIREKIMTSFRPYADQLTNEIFGTDKKLEDCMLPEELINDFLVPIDHMMLELALKNPKLSLMSVNTARMNFLYDIVITRLLMPLASSNKKIEGTEGKEKWPSQLEIWLQSAVMLSLKSEWQNFFKKFIEKSNASLPKNIEYKINILAEDLAKSRISELQKNSSRYLVGANPLSPRNVKENKNLLELTKKEMNFYNLPSDFIKFISSQEKHFSRDNKQGSRLNVLSELQENTFKYQAKIDASRKILDPNISKFSEKLKEMLILESKKILAEESSKQSRPKTTAFHKTDHATLMRDVKKEEESLINAQLQATGATSHEKNTATMPSMTTTVDVPDTLSLSNITSTKLGTDASSEKN